MGEEQDVRAGKTEEDGSNDGEDGLDEEGGGAIACCPQGQVVIFSGENGHGVGVGEGIWHGFLQR